MGAGSEKTKKPDATAVQTHSNAKRCAMLFGSAALGRHAKPSVLWSMVSADVITNRPLQWWAAGEVQNAFAG